MPCRASWGSTRVGQGSRNKGKAWAGAFIVIPVGKARQRRVHILGLARLNHSARLWAIRMISSVQHLSLG